MLITATKIAQWAKTKKAQLSLPKLIRRLVNTAGTPTHVDFPAGDSTGLPGWDGELVSEQGSPWVPKGKSFWEFSCEAAVTSKANKDYEKRTKNTPRKIRSRAILVVLSARKWSQKKAWLKRKREAKKWADVRAYDANDIEQWLEQNRAVALEFAEELGLIGHGVESVVKHWEGWSQQSDPPISAEAFFIDRQAARERFIAELRRRLQADQPDLYTMRADSVDEAAAFVCASIISHPDLMAHSVVVKSADGWRFVETNRSIKIAIATRPEIAEGPTRRNGLVVVIPYAAGDMAAYYRGAAARDQDIIIERPRIHEFETALVSLGLDEAEANRLAGITGRSWSVFRRHHAINPAIRRPTWLDAPQAGALSTLCLLGGWSADQTADRDVVSRLSSRPYEEVERDLRYLSQLDDAPVLLIGNVWKAKAPLELLQLFGDRITSDKVNRFFEVAREIFMVPDPVLELVEEERFAAQVYGKVRPQSGLLIESLCDTLIKLAVRGTQLPTLSAAKIEGRIAALVRELLDDADSTRWLSLSSLLPSLAEAAPNDFLRAIELSLAKPDTPVTRLIAETKGSGLMGRCWHAGLLWALEALAWSPERLARVALILARLAHVEIKGNWANSPKASLLDIFRSWIPQTAADFDQRIAVLDILIAKEPEVAFNLLDSLVHVGPDTASPSARPKWRDDDTGAGRGVTPAEQHKMLVAAADRLIACSAEQPDRVACLIQKISIFDAQRVKATLALADQFTKNSASDEDREIIRIALRKKIYWHRNYDDTPGKELDDKLRDVENLYEKLSPKDLIVRHRWLFAKDWPELPIPACDKDYEKRYELIETLRLDALREIHAELTLQGVEWLDAACVNQPFVGITLAKLKIQPADLADWIVKKGGDFTSCQSFKIIIRGLLRASETQRSTELIKAVLKVATKQAWNAERTANFLALAPEGRSTWDVVTSRGPEVERFYWARTSPGIWLRRDDEDFEFALQRLVEVGRPRTALQVCHLDIKKVDPKLLAEMLERMLKGEEPGGWLLDSWYIGKALEFLEASGTIDKGWLIRLEFGLIPMLGHEGEQRAKSLYEAIMSDPKLFLELLCVVYKPATGGGDDIKSEAEKATAEIAYRVLDNCHCQPGTQPDGTIDPNAFNNFINEVRELSRKADRLDICDSKLGQILARAPADADGVWPFKPARNILDRPEREKMRHGFLVGAMNKRGTTWRAYDEGGVQERKLADVYRDQSRALCNSHPNVAATLEELARCYESDGLQQDVRAKLRHERA